MGANSMNNQNPLPGKQYFHFTIGPVQGFVAQARRTRDFWAGSFLLSWLSAVAMRAVIAQTGTIVFPAADQNFLDWLEGNGDLNKKPAQGSIPNRFKAEITNGFLPEEVVRSVQTAWKAVADTVYNNDLEDIADKITREIWDRQVQNFWEMNWVIVEDKNNSSALDQRKNWRSHLPPPEPGVKCMMMDGLQELSGARGPMGLEGEKLKDFWQQLRNQKKIGIASDLREQEHLCAIAFIKRRFSRYFAEVSACMVNDWSLHQEKWTMNTARPSVVYMAAVHWLEALIKKANKDPEIAEALWAFHDKALELTEGEYAEWDNNIKCIEDAIQANPNWSVKKWKALDGNVFFEHALENKNTFPNQALAGKVKQQLRKLQKSMGNAEGGIGLRPSPFYAVLMMDGDSLGSQMSDSNKQPIITEGLKQFTEGVEEKVWNHNGFLIYAGGDDVLAVLPLEDALPCALELRQFYMSCFPKDSEIEIQTSLSGAVEFAHMKMPLTKILKDAHILLDKVAKAERGRDALAVRIWKPGGKEVEWSMPWKMAIEDNSLAAEKQKLIITQLADTFNQNNEQIKQFSNKFLFAIQRHCNLLYPDDAATSGLEEKTAVILIAGEYLSSGICKVPQNPLPDKQRQAIMEEYFPEKPEGQYRPAQDLIQAIGIIHPLVQQCRVVNRLTPDEGKPSYSDQPVRYTEGGTRLVRFLAQKGVE
jgi:CRISPR-associated protein Cmr2